MIDLDAVRADTPACARLTHLNNAGASLPPQPVVDATIGHLRLEAEIGGYEAADVAAERIDRSYHAISALLGCDPAEVAFATSATDAWNKAFSCFALQPGDRVLVTRIEYVSNVLPLLQAARRDGVVIDVVPSTPTGETDADALAAMLDDRVRLVAATYVPTQGGIVNDIAGIGARTRAAGVPFLVDACQAVGQMPIDVDALGCDFLTATGRKFLRAPRGTGFLYARGSTLGDREPAGLDDSSAEWTAPFAYRVREGARRFEQFERNVAGQIGLGAAVEYALAVGLGAIEARVRSLAADLRALLGARPGVTLHDEGRAQSGIVTFAVAGYEAADVMASLREQGINVSVSSARSARFDLDGRGITSLLRASPHYFNIDNDLVRLAEAVPRGRAT